MGQYDTDRRAKYMRLCDLRKQQAQRKTQTYNRGSSVRNEQAQPVHITYLIRHLSKWVLEKRPDQLDPMPVKKNVWEVRAVEENRVAETIHSFAPRYFGTVQEAERYACIRLFDVDPVPQLDSPKEIKIYEISSTSEMRFLSGSKGGGRNGARVSSTTHRRAVRRC